MRKSYGNTWWGKQWLNALSQIDYSNRLPRGRSYANKGAVTDLEINQHSIVAKVHGSRPRPYKVDIEIPVFSVSEKARLLEIVTSNPLFLSQLLNRELPTSLFQICLQNNIHLFPRNWSDLKGECSCPDWAVPCKHIAAVLYLIANEIDKNPFLVFELHNFDLFKGLAGIGYTQTSQQEIDIPNLPIRSADTHLSPALTDEDLAVPDFSNIPDCSEQIFTLLKEQPVFYPSGDFKQLLQKIYKKTVKEVLQMKKKRTSEADRTNALQIEYIKLTVDRAGHFLNCELSNEKKEVVLQFEDEDELIDWLHGFSMADMELFSPAMKGLVLSFYFAEKLVAQSAIIPKLFQAYPTGYRLRWQAAILNEEVAKVYYLVQAFIPYDILLYNIDGSKWIPEKEDTFPALLSFFLGYFVHSFHDLDYRYQIEPVVRLFFKGTVEGFSAFEEQSYPGAIHLWLSRFYLSAQAYAPVLQVDDLDGQFRVKIGIDDPEEALATPIPLQQIFEQDTYADARLGILRNLALMTEYFPQISKSVSSLGKEDLYFDAASFAPVLLNIIPTIRLFGIKVLLPKALQKLLRPQLAMDLEGEEDGKVSGSSILSLDSMLRFQWRVAIGDQHLSKEDFEKLVKQLSGIVKLKDEYAFFDAKDIRKLLDKLENPPTINSHELLQIVLTEEYEGASVKLDTTARKRINELLDVKSIPPPQHLQATLRPYQQRGYEWLVKNTQLGFGSLIADDMGLGKTLQVIATLLKLKEEGHLSKNKALVIVPTTLLTNWLREIQKFAPALKAHLYHGPQRSLEPLAEADVLITTYGVVRSETAKLQKMKWQAVVIDEAQNIKNPKTAQTKAVKKMKAPVKIAMSGTPVENRLSEYWSIFDFSNTKYLGSLSKFKDEFARPIEQERDQEQLDRFRKITSPFILRRLKSDKSIIQDLPEKIEQDQFCQLSSEQAALYQNVLDNTLKAIEAVDGIHRRGLILKLITALKQVCNHPYHFLKKGAQDIKLSGKTEMLFSLLSQMLSTGQKALIFTQYREMGTLLARLIQQEFGLSTPFLHGGVSRKGRDEMVHDFQENRGTPLMLLSLKAAGTGLNLTAANNVIHYDLWWNPAVEAQATDRAYRIGQTSNVMVHRFITQSTFEEKINQLIQQKKELADLTVATGEKWIGELSDQELKSLVQLG